MKGFTYLFLLVASALTIGTMARATGGSFDAATFGFMAWAISPYVAFGLLVYVLGRFAKIAHLYQVAAAVAAIMLLFTAYCYLVAMDGTSSTEALAFVFVPLYLHIGADAALGIGVVISKVLSGPAAA
jgi:hypothetical protein